MLSRLFCLGAVLLGLAPMPAWAHEIKVLASDLNPAVAGKSTIYLAWGHRLPVDDLIDAATLERYELVLPDGKAASLKRDGLSLHANSVFFDREGLHQAAVVRKANVHTYILDEEGKKQLKRGPKSQYAGMKIDSSIRSKQFGKTMIQVGKSGSYAPKPLDHDLEILPLSPPSEWKAGADLRVRVMFEGKPLQQAPLTALYVTSRPETEETKPIQANAQGEASLRLSEPGIWVIVVQHRRPAAAADRMQFDMESYTATLSLLAQTSSRVP